MTPKLPIMHFIILKLVMLMNVAYSWPCKKYKWIIVQNIPKIQKKNE